MHGEWQESHTNYRCIQYSAKIKRRQSNHNNLGRFFEDQGDNLAETKRRCRNGWELIDLFLVYHSFNCIIIQHYYTTTLLDTALKMDMPKAKRRNPKKIRVFLADDHAIFCETLQYAFQQESNLELVGFAHELQDIEQKLAEYKPDVFLVDLSFPLCLTLDVLKGICSDSSTPPVVVLSMHNDDDAILRCLQAGVSGFVSKADDLKYLVEAIQAAQTTKTYLSPMVSGVRKRTCLDFSLLTSRESDVLRLLVQGLELPEVAKHLSIAYQTAYMHQQSAVRRTGVGSAKELVEQAVLASRFSSLFPND